MSTESAASSAATTPRWARKSTLVLAMTVLALLVFGATTQTWIEVQLDPNGASNSNLHVQGNKAATAVTALALVALAGGLAASIAGKIARWVIAAIIGLSAVGIILAAITVVVDPLGPPKVPSLPPRASQVGRPASPPRHSPSWLSWRARSWRSALRYCRQPDATGSPGPSTMPELAVRRAATGRWTRSTAGTASHGVKIPRSRPSNSLSGRRGAT